MAWKNKVIWSEGMLLQPQHLQQHDRYWQSQLENRVAALRPYSWGFAELTVDPHQLALGKVALQSCTAVLPDGSPCMLPADDVLPLPLDVPPDTRDALVVLALPVRRHGMAETAGPLGDGEPGNFARHRVADYEAWDSNGLDNSALMQVGQLRLRLALAASVANGWSGIGVVRIVERRADNRLVVDPEYCPPCLDFRAAPRLAAFADELAGLLHQRADVLAARLSQPGANGAGDIADFLLLQLLNRAEPGMAHLASASGIHPETLYAALVALAGELATFTDAGKRATAYPAYRHDALAGTFAPVMRDLRRALSTVMDAQAVAIALEERQFGIRVAVVADRALLAAATFILVVKAAMPAEAVRTAFPAQVKIGSVEKIRDLVNLQLPGIGLRALPVAPRQLPFYAGHTYFELDSDSDYFRQLQQSAGFAMHVAGDFPGLQLQFWAIRKGAEQR